MTSNCIISKPGIFFLTVFSVLSFGCMKEYSCENCIPAQKYPVAIAGNDHQITLPLDSVIVDAGASFDPDGSPLLYSWKKVAGPASGQIVNNQIAATLIKNLTQGNYEIELKVTNQKGLSSSDTIKIIVNPLTGNRPPVANAGPDQSYSSPLPAIYLDGSASSDPDNNIVSYSWVRIAGSSSFLLINATQPRVTVLNLLTGTHMFELTVTDAGGLFSRDVVRVDIQ